MTRSRTATPPTTHRAPAGEASSPGCGAAGVSPDHEVIGYRSGQCRNDERALSHTYAMMANGDLWPMCGYGWNRSGGDAFSIFRGTPGSEGDCRICRKNVAAKKPPVFDGFPHKTRWL